MGRSWSSGLGVLGMLVLVSALLAPDAYAKTWAKWAPSPLASDSAYVALSAKPADSLTAAQFAWLGVQREWRKERDEETTYATSREIDAGRLHVPRNTDRRFAGLASRPYAELTAGEVAWLVEENASRREARRAGSDPEVAVVILAILAGLAGGFIYLHSQFDWGH